MTRILTAIGLVVFAVYMVFFAPQQIFFGGAFLMGALCYYEYSDLVAAYRIPKPGFLGFLLGAFVLFAPQYLLPLTSVWLMAQFVWLLKGAQTPAVPHHSGEEVGCASGGAPPSGPGPAVLVPPGNLSLRQISPAAACTLLGAFYCFAPWRFAVDLRAASVHLLFFALALNWIGDSSAFYVGRKFGRHKLAPVVSPAKSWEGAVASVAGSILFALLYLHYTFPRASAAESVVLAALGNVSGQFGDLVESSIKRGAGMKDSGRLLPGHGGVLDRLDSSLFALPTVLIVAKLFHLC